MSDSEMLDHTNLDLCGQQKSCLFIGLVFALDTHYSSLTFSEQIQGKEKYPLDPSNKSE